MAISVTKLRALMKTPGEGITALAPVCDAAPTIADAQQVVVGIEAWEAEGLLAPAPPTQAARECAKAVAHARSLVLASIAKAGGATAPSTLEREGWASVIGTDQDSAVLYSAVATALGFQVQLCRERDSDLAGAFGQVCDVGKRGQFIKGKTPAPKPAQAVARLARDWCATQRWAFDAARLSATVRGLILGQRAAAA